MNSLPDSPLFVTTANALRATANASPRPSPGLDPYTGFICTRAALGLAYSGTLNLPHTPLSNGGQQIPA
jgi:hypothetical protein